MDRWKPHYRLLAPRYGPLEAPLKTAGHPATDRYMPLDPHYKTLDTPLQAIGCPDRWIPCYRPMDPR